VFGDGEIDYLGSQRLGRLATVGIELRSLSFFAAAAPLGLTAGASAQELRHTLEGEDRWLWERGRRRP
jgi:hypothetical protein